MLFCELWRGPLGVRLSEWAGLLQLASLAAAGRERAACAAPRVSGLGGTDGWNLSLHAREQPAWSPCACAGLAVL